MSGNTKFNKLSLSLIVGIIALLLAACSSNSSNGYSASSTTSKTNTPTTVKSADFLQLKSSSFGNIIVSQSKMTLYMLTADTATKSACTGSCLNIWPPVTSPAVVNVGSGLNKKLVGQITLANGLNQITYNGHPLYTFSGDGQPGQYNGEGLSFPAGSSSPKGHWYVIDAAGNPVTSGSASSSSGSSGYSYNG